MALGNLQKDSKSSVMLASYFVISSMLLFHAKMQGVHLYLMQKKKKTLC